MAHHREKSGRPQSGIQGPAMGLTSYCPARVTPIPREASSHGLAFARQAPQPGVPFPLWPGETLHLTFAPAPLPAAPAATLGSCGLRAYTLPLGNSIYRNCLSRKWFFSPQSFQLDSKFPEKAPPWGPCPSCNPIQHADTWLPSHLITIYRKSNAHQVPHMWDLRGVHEVLPGPL